MRKSKFLVFIATFLICISTFSSVVFAADDEYYYNVNSNNGNTYVVYDNASLFSYAEIQSLLRILREFSDRGNCAIATVSYNKHSSTKALCQELYDYWFDSKSGILFMIDMDNRYLGIYADGELKNTITSSVSDIITDNVYSYATDGDYLACSMQAFSMLTSVLDGQSISQPMKYISNACIAIVLGLFICFFIALITSRTAKPSDNQILENIYSHFMFYHSSTLFINETRRYSPRSSGGGHGGGGGGGGGGSFGGHSF